MALADVPEPQCAPEEALVAVRAISINRGIPTIAAMAPGKGCRAVSLDFFDWVRGTAAAPIHQFDYTVTARPLCRDLAVAGQDVDDTSVR